MHNPADDQIKKLKTILKIELIILPFALLTLFVDVYPVKTNVQVLGVQQTTLSPTPTLLPTPSPTMLPTPTPTALPEPTAQPTPQSLPRKNSYSIAVFGDSMVDTMGELLEYLNRHLKTKYPSVNFSLYNYGIGSQNIEMGLNRWDKKFDYQTRHYPAITELRPDILIIGSFAYNPFSPYDRDRHWVNLTKLISSARTVSSRVYLLAEIAPLRRDFGKGPNGVNWDETSAYEHSKKIIELLENTVSLAKVLNVPLINAYQQSGGAKAYVNSNDGIHASVAGHHLTADLIAETIRLD